MNKTQMASEEQAERACKYLRTIIEAAENSNQAGEDAAVKAADAVRLPDDANAVERDQLKELCAELAETAKKFLSYLESGTLIRDISKDHEPGWAVKMIQFVNDLKKLQEAIAKAEEDKTDE